MSNDPISNGPMSKRPYAGDSTVNEARRREEFLPFSPPLLGEEEIQEVVSTLRSGWLTTGPKTREFEASFADYLGAPGALATNSCTASMHLALAVAGIGPGDEVITTPMTFAASVNVIEHVGATPILVDVEPDYLTLDVDAVREAVTERTRGIIAVHYAGHPVDMAPLRALKRTHDLTIVEDAAHALPTSYRGERVGSGSDPVAFSFYSTKNLTTGEGGMLTGDPDFLDRARVMGLHGMSRDAWKRYDKGGRWFYEVTAPGFKYNMPDIQASIGLRQLEKLDRFQARRRQVVQAYDEAFRSEPALDLPTAHPDAEHAWHLYVLRLRPEALRIDRDRFIEEMNDRNIGTSVHFIPIHVHPYYREKYGYTPESLPIAYGEYRRMLSLPLNPTLTRRDVNDVVEAVLDIVHEFRA